MSTETVTLRISSAALDRAVQIADQLRGAGFPGSIEDVLADNLEHALIAEEVRDCVPGFSP